MPGWETLVRVSRSSAWGSVNKITDFEGFFLDVDSITPDLGAVFQERDNKVSGNREALNSSWSVDDQNPKCTLKIQPRVDDMLMFLMAYFQHCVVSGNATCGTYVFSKIEKNPTWTTGAVNYGTNAYGINLDICYGQSFMSGTQANGIRLFNCIVDKLGFNMKYGDDLSMDIDVKALTGSRYNYPTTFAPPCSFGSFSSQTRLVDYHGTITTGTETLELDKWKFTLNNNTDNKTKLGQRGYSRFPFANKMKIEGDFSLELARDMSIFTEGSPWDIAGTVTSTGLGGTSGVNGFIARMPNAVLKPTTIPINGGEGIISFTQPFRAFPSTGGTTGITITVYTGTLLGGTNFMGFGSMGTSTTW
jgi:hypothetical protein